MPRIPVPPEDRSLSPYTGWGRAHWEAAADGLLTAALRHAGPRHALLSLPGPRPSWSGPRSDGLEGYARTFLMAAFRVAGAGGQDPLGLLDRYAQGLEAGTRSPTTAREVTAGDPFSWPAVTDRGQAIVEAASIALGLRLTRPWLWDRLPGHTRERAADWLAGALRHTPVDNNWWLFQVAVGGFLAETGHHVRAAEEAVRRGLDRIERWYVGGGWYTDGRPRAFDHYNGWAFHLYPVLHAHLAGDRQALERYGTRLSEYLELFARTFGGDGAPLHQGRSLTYRFAAAAALWAGALSGRSPLAPGATRRLASGALRYFLDREEVCADGLLTLGWFGPCPPMVQGYSGPASPYWASKGFLGLLLPAGHPVWTAPEEAAPVERGDAVRPAAGPGWLVQSTAADGLVRVHNHGSDDQPADEVLPDDPLYARLAYSTATAPVFAAHSDDAADAADAAESADADDTADVADNHFALLVDGGASERGRITPLGTGADWAASAHRPRAGGAELPGVRVTSLVCAAGALEVHAHLVTGAAVGTPVRHTGWAVAGAAVETAVTGARARALVAGRPLVSEAVALHGFTGATAVTPRAGTAFGPAAAVPALTGTVTAAECLFVSLLRLSGAGDAGDAGDAERPAVRVTAHRSAQGHRLLVHWPDGSRCEAVVRAGAVAVTPGGG
ncbi:DUF2264 domain-containing protein [Streptomyces seoulensis]|nr:DUF2264 domain-containing protein [Streptomyces seoulensis]